MANSTRYNSLVTRIDQLNVHLLPVIDPTVSYSEKDIDLTRAFCLLCHAEIEAYLEDFTLEVVTKAFNQWNTDKKSISPIIFHLIYSYTGQKEAPYSMVHKSFLSLKKTIETNNGIKEHNLISFFKPIGFEVDPTLRTVLNEFGKTRGQIAHTSFHTQSPLDPATEKATVELIKVGLKSFDDDLTNYELSGMVAETPVWMQWKKLGLVNRFKILFFGKL